MYGVSSTSSVAQAVPESVKCQRDIIRLRESGLQDFRP